MSTKLSPVLPLAIPPMTETASPQAFDQPDGPTEVARLNKIIGALMDRAERNTSAQQSDFGVFQTTIMLEERVRRRTAELEAALHENEKINRALRESEAKFRGLVSQSLVGIVLIEDGKFSYSNAKFDETFGYSSDEIRGMGPLQVAVESDRALVSENIDKRLNGEVDQLHYVFHGLRKNGEVIDIECHSSVMHDGERLLLISLIMDISERSRAERAVRVLQEELRELSTHDALTGLYNRRYLEESFRRELLLAERAGHPVSVIMGDLDHFKAVNDRDGHLAGDEVLRVFGNLMKHNARGSDIICRYGGEEFLLVLPGMTQEGALERAEQLRRSMAATRFSYGASQITVTASFGIAAFPSHGRTTDDLIAAADTALYSAKAAGRNRVCLSSEPSKNVGKSVQTGERETASFDNARGR
jgi:diguanylate cyclase (GGDEF)-like protein/PAS domain S-box-containing protein